MWNSQTKQSIPLYQKIKNIWSQENQQDSIFSIGNQELLSLGSVLHSLQTFDNIPEMNIVKKVKI